jgi:hypothetical protein
MNHFYSETFNTVFNFSSHFLPLVTEIFLIVILFIVVYALYFVGRKEEKYSILIYFP